MHWACRRRCVDSARSSRWGADAQHLTGQPDGPLGLVHGYPGVLHCGSFAKYAVAFPRMSRSMRRRAFSARERASSICSALTGLSPTPLSWPLFAHAHPIAQGLHRHAQDLGRHRHRLPTLDQANHLQLEFQGVPAPRLSVFSLAHLRSPITDFHISYGVRFSGARSLAIMCSKCCDE